MALAKRLSDLFSPLYNPITNPGGGVKTASPAPSILSSNNPAPIDFSRLTMKPAPTAPITPSSTATARPLFAPPVQAAPVAPATPATPSPQTPIPAQWRRADGSIKTAAEIAADVAASMKAAHGAPDVGRLAVEQFSGQDKSAVQLEAEARGIANTQNDIAVGETDPYKVASQSGVAYTPAELKAIENAYAGIYDPALDTALAKLNAKKESDKAAAAAKAEADKPYTLGTNDIRYDKDGKVIARGAAPASTITASSGVYVPGANPAVDAWAQRIFDGSAKITDIPATQKGMRDAVVIALQASGNDLAGHPTVTELGKRSAIEAQALLQKLADRTGTSAVGTSRFFTGGSLAIPGTDKSNFVIDFQNLKDMLSLDGVKYLKGQGSVSDAERALLASAVTKLNLSQSEDEFKSTLEGIVKQLNGGGDAGGGITVTAGGQTYTFPDQASADAFKKEAGI